MFMFWRDVVNRSNCDEVGHGPDEAEMVEGEVV